MSQETISQIKTILINAKGEPLITSKIVQKLRTEYGYKGNRETVRRLLNYMETELEIVCSVLQPDEKKNAWIWRENDNIQNGLKSEQSTQKNDIRIKHSEYIKDNIIRPWLQQLPKKNDLIFLWSDNIFPIEKDELFQDFKKHVKSDYGNPFDELDIFKQVLHQFLSKKRELQDQIFDIFLKTKKNYFDKERGWYHNLNAIADFIIDKTISGRNMDFRSIFINDFSSHVEEKNGEYLYFAMDYPEEMVATIGGRETRFKEKMDKVVIKSLENTAKSELIQKNITALCELQEKLVKQIENMRKSLKKHNALGILPNRCEYCE